MSLSIEYMDGLGGFGAVAKPVLKKPVVKKVVAAPKPPAKPATKVLPVQAAAKAVVAVAKPKPAPAPVKTVAKPAPYVAPAPVKASVPIKAVTPTYTAPPKLTIVKPTVTTTTTTTATLLAAKASLPKGTYPVVTVPKTTTVIGGKTFTSTAPAPTKVMAPYQPPKTTSLINPALVGGKGSLYPTGTTTPIIGTKSGSLVYNPLAPAPSPIKLPLPGKTAFQEPAQVYPIGVKQPGVVAPTYAPPPTGNTWSGPAPVAPGTQMPASQGYGQTPYNGGFQPYGDGDSYGMTAQQAAEAAADQAAASDPLVSSGEGGGGGGGAAAEGEAAAEAAAEKPGLKVRHVVGGAAVIGVLAYFLL